MLVPELIADALMTLPASERRLVSRVYLDGDTEWRISRETGMGLTEVRADLRCSLERLRWTLRVRGVTSTADVF